ncbi:YtxH domain-containing protein [Paenibacillus rhizoplanae]|uniref:YtxH domain-containing protein n=1 Tax=Paenibacillus rhizoplanae TaxID=1917181 RepID=UPI00361D32FE
MNKAEKEFPVESGSTFFKGIFIGGLLGAAAALLFAPKPGREMRSDLSDKLTVATDKTKEVAGAVTDKTKTIATTVGEKATDLAGTVSAKASDIFTTVSDSKQQIAATLAETGKDWRNGKRCLQGHHGQR